MRGGEEETKAVINAFEKVGFEKWRGNNSCRQ